MNKSTNKQRPLTKLNEKHLMNKFKINWLSFVVCCLCCVKSSPDFKMWALKSKHTVHPNETFQEKANKSTITKIINLEIATINEKNRKNSLHLDKIYELQSNLLKSCFEKQKRKKQKSKKQKIINKKKEKRKSASIIVTMRKMNKTIRVEERIEK